MCDQYTLLTEAHQSVPIYSLWWMQAVNYIRSGKINVFQIANPPVRCRGWCVVAGDGWLRRVIRKVVYNTDWFENSVWIMLSLHKRFTLVSCSHPTVWKVFKSGLVSCSSGLLFPSYWSSAVKVSRTCLLHNSILHRPKPFVSYHSLWRNRNVKFPAVDMVLVEPLALMLVQ